MSAARGDRLVLLDAATSVSTINSMSLPLRASLYVRLSREATAANTSLEGMAEDLRGVCSREGFEEVNLHVDDGKSGAIRNRPAFLAWLADAREGRAEVLLTWHVDRLTREGLNVAATLLDVVEGKDSVSGKVVRPPVRLMDVKGIDSEHGDSFRFQFLIQAEVARAERERIRDRVRASKRRLSAGNRFSGGPPPYGYRSAANPDGPGRVLEIAPEEARFIRLAAAHVLDGRSLYSAMRMLQESGSTPRRAKAWALKSLSIVLTGDPVLGRATRKGALLRDEQGAPVAPWPPILTVSEVEQLRAALAPKPLSAQRRRATRLLSGLLTCHSCHSRLRVNVGGPKGRKMIRYACFGKSDGRGCASPVSIMAEPLENYITRRYLNAYSAVPLMRRVEALPEEESLIDVEREIRDTAAAMTSDDADVVALASRLAMLKVQRTELRARPPARLVRLEPTGMSHQQAWDAADITGRRALIAAEYAIIRIRPGVKGRRGLDTTRVLLVRKPAFIVGQQDPREYIDGTPAMEVDVDLSLPYDDR